MNTKELEEHIEVLKDGLGSGLISCDIWVSGTGQPIASYNGGNVKATALFDQITTSIEKALRVAEFPEMDPYYLLHLDNGLMLTIVIYDKYQFAFTVEPEKTPLGLVLNIAIPNLLENLKK